MNMNTDFRLPGQENVEPKHKVVKNYLKKELTPNQKRAQQLRQMVHEGKMSKEDYLDELEKMNDKNPKFQELSNKLNAYVKKN
jgi:hypothetical protein